MARPRTIVFGSLAALLLAVGGTFAGFAVIHQVHAPQPPPSAAGALNRYTPPVPDPSLAPSPAGQVQALPASQPTTISIPAIGVSSVLLRLGENVDGTLAVPPPGPSYNDAAWYEFSPTPGQLGPAVIEGHVDSAHDGPSVFFRLGALRPGDKVRVTRADRTVAVFTIDGLRAYPKDNFPTRAVYGDTTRPELRLITCGGSFDRQTGHYRSNIVAFAHLTATQTATDVP